MEKHYQDMGAVHADDLTRLLSKVGLLKQFENGRLKCKFCGDVVVLDNIYSVIKDAGSYKVVCDKAECVNQLMAFLASRKAKIG